MILYDFQNMFAHAPARLGLLALHWRPSTGTLDLFRCNSLHVAERVDGILYYRVALLWKAVWITGIEGIPPTPAAPAAPCLQPRNIQPSVAQLSTHKRRMQIMFTAWGHSGQEVQGEGGLLCKTKRRRTNETLRLWALLLDRANSWGV